MPPLFHRPHRRGALVLLHAPRHPSRTMRLEILHLCACKQIGSAGEDDRARIAGAKCVLISLLWIFFFRKREIHPLIRIKVTLLGNYRPDTQGNLRTPYFTMYRTFRQLCQFMGNYILISFYGVETNFQQPSTSLQGFSDHKALMTCEQSDSRIAFPSHHSAASGLV